MASSQVALITGASSGIGQATARRLARGGCRLSLCGRDAARLHEAAQAVESESLETTGDLRRAGDVERVVAATMDAYGRIDLLINNAGAAVNCPLEETTDEQFAVMMELNVQAVFRMARAVWPVMQRQGAGIIVNISSQAARDPFPGFSVYGASKAWVELFTLAMAREGRAHGIRVHGIRPGAVETPMLRSLFPEFPAEQTVSPDDVAATIWAVCQAPFANSSGQTIAVSQQ